MSKKLIRPGLTATTSAVRRLLAAGWESDYVHPVGDDMTVLSMQRGEPRITASVGDDDHTVDLEITGLSMHQAAAVAAAVAAPTGAAGWQSYEAYIEAVEVALSTAEVTVYYTAIRPDLAELWLTPLETTEDEANGVVLKWRPDGWQLVQLVDGRQAETRRVGLPMAAPADVARVVAQAMAIDEEPDTGANPGGQTETPDPRRIAYERITVGISAGLPLPEGVALNSFGVIEVQVGDGDVAAADAWSAHLKLPKPMLGDVLKGAGRHFRVYKSRVDSHPDIPGWDVRVVAYCDVEPAGGAQ